ncbi:hypothetical protein A2U01_0084643, partial [Trifolium medium]|nr:hypothetical protein [Trifolium medium]
FCCTAAAPPFPPPSLSVFPKGDGTGASTDEFLSNWVEL